MLAWLPDFQGAGLASDGVKGFYQRYELGYCDKDFFRNFLDVAFSLTNISISFIVSSVPESLSFITYILLVRLASESPV